MFFFYKRGRIFLLNFENSICLWNLYFWMNSKIKKFSLKLLIRKFRQIQTFILKCACIYTYSKVFLKVLAKVLKFSHQTWCSIVLNIYLIIENQKPHWLYNFFLINLRSRFSCFNRLKRRKLENKIISSAFFFLFTKINEFKTLGKPIIKIN